MNLGEQHVTTDRSSLTDSAGRAAGTEAANDLTVEKILAWADAFHAAHGCWPSGRVDSGSGPVEGVPGETWQGINRALALGGRGLPGDSSLGELLAEQRCAPLPDMGPKALADKIWAWEQMQFPVKGPRRTRRVQPEYRRPRLTVEQILAWADAHHAATGEWPNGRMGLVSDVPFEVTWRIIDSSLSKGLRGLPGASSLAQLLAEHRDLGPDLHFDLILVWADAHHAATGAWPTFTSGKVAASPGETWAGIDTLLRIGGRGVRPGQSLALLLQKYRGVRNRPCRHDLTLEQVLAWVDAHHAATGDWPTRESGPLTDGPADATWATVDFALGMGVPELPAGWSLARLVDAHRSDRPPLTLEQIFAWAAAFRAAARRWPNANSGRIKNAPGESWRGIDSALRIGGRGLATRCSLDRLLREHQRLAASCESA
jgi:hypothetical protein